MDASFRTIPTQDVLRRNPAPKERCTDRRNKRMQQNATQAGQQSRAAEDEKKEKKKKTRRHRLTLVGISLLLSLHQIADPQRKTIGRRCLYCVILWGAGEILPLPRPGFRPESSDRSLPATCPHNSLQIAACGLYVRILVNAGVSCSCEAPYFLRGSQPLSFLAATDVWQGQALAATRILRYIVLLTKYSSTTHR